MSTVPSETPAGTIDFSSVSVLGLAFGSDVSFNGIGIFNVKAKAYAAKGDGVTDDTAAIQAAINAAAANGGGIVFFPPGTYICNHAQPTDTQGGIWLLGSGIGATIIKGNNGAIGSVIGITRDSMVSDLTVDGGGVCPTVLACGNNAGGAVDFLAFKNVRIRNGGAGNGWLFFVNGNAANPISHVSIENVMLEGPSSTVQDAMAIGNQQHGILNCTIRGLYINGVYRSPNIFAVDNLEASGIYIKGVSNVAALVIDQVVGRAVLSNIVVDSACAFFIVSCPDTIVSDSLFDSGLKLNQATTNNPMTRFSAAACRFGLQLQRYGPSGNNPNVTLTGCTFVPTGSAAAIDDFAGGTWSNWRIVGCQFVNGGSTGAWIHNTSGASLTNSVIEDCDIISGSNGIFGAGTGLVLRNVRGFNPIGKQTPPAIPASGTALLNPFNFDCTVHITGGTVTAVSIGGNATGLIAGTFRVPAFQTITLTYTAGPSWVWFGD